MNKVIKLSGTFKTVETQDDWKQAELESFRESEAKVDSRNAVIDSLYASYVLAAADADKLSEIISRVNHADFSKSVFKDDSAPDSRFDTLEKAYKILSEERCKKLHAWIESLHD